MNARALIALALIPLASAGATLTRTIAEGDLDNDEPLRAWSGKPLSLADVDGDGKLDILGQNENKRVYAIDPRREKLLIEVAPRYPYGPDLGPFNGPKAADLDGDGIIELVNVDRSAGVTVWKLHNKDGSLKAEKAWSRHLDDHHGHPTADAGPVLADIDGDGALEIIVHTEETGLYALRSNGSVLWSLANYGGNAEPRVADVDGDGDLDVVVFTDGGVAYAVEGRTGKSLWRFDSRKHGAWPASITAPGVVADLDGDGRVEVVFCARNIENGSPDHAPYPYTRHHFMLFAIRDGELLWSRKPSWGNPLCAAYLFALDADGDGKLELYGMDWNTIGHKPGNWERADEAHVFAFDHKGNERWHRSVRPWNAKATIASGDWNGDGKLDIVAYTYGALEIFNARDGRFIEHVPLGGEVTQGPMLADLDGDGDTDAVVAVGSKLLILDTRAPVMKGGWPGWDEIPAGTRPRPPPPPPPPTPSPAVSPVPPPSPAPASVSPPLSTPASPAEAPTATTPSALETSARIPASGLLVALALAVAARSAMRRDKGHR